MKPDTRCMQRSSEDHNNRSRHNPYMVNLRARTSVFYFTSGGMQAYAVSFVDDMKHNSKSIDDLLRIMKKLGPESMATVIGFAWANFTARLWLSWKQHQHKCVRLTQRYRSDGVRHRAGRLHICHAPRNKRNYIKTRLWKKVISKQTHIGNQDHHNKQMAIYNQGLSPSEFLVRNNHDVTIDRKGHCVICINKE